MSIPEKSMLDDGFYQFEKLLDQKKIKKLYTKMIESRHFDESLFLSEEEYERQSSHKNANPTSEFNFLGQFANELDVVEKNESITNTLTNLLGYDYEIVIKKAVCGVPESWLPDWIKSRIDGVNVANLGPFIKKEFRDITYFRGIDFHQDIIDWPLGMTDLDPATFITLYVYIHDVDEYDSPLHVLPRTHKLGATLFPHKLEKEEGERWIYESDSGARVEVKDRILTGQAGYTAMWHNCTLHGTQPVQHESEKFRLSLRYLIGKSKANKEWTVIDDINKTVEGDLTPIRTRKDLDEAGKAKIKGNIINKY
ncbi:mitomycin antibiotic biosynthesis protein [Oleiphilus sp. HI0125]|uniref:phytanoyl-CoA dioxygenase family protein n=1 Tax=Oleiphilus sp. HI0125 TaxID=1822266 RepID=UPI0007C214F1|nr:phytanoyl-CoA dioxygenase family protein [Oleiphilus sp. HI0125]KZZ60847.1 mitomycin antibiotic biosynthesis protein [Oleiphilus sp. HI0125]